MGIPTAILGQSEPPSFVAATAELASIADAGEPAAVLASVKDKPFGGAEEAPSLTAAARDGDGNMRSGRKNARGAGRTKEWNDKGRQKWRDAPWTKKAPYKPDDARVSSPDL